MSWSDDLERCAPRRGIRVLVAVWFLAISGWLPACGGGGGGSGPTSVPEPPLAEEGNASCLDRADFGDPSQSAYVLPYPVGQASEAITSYCSGFTFPDHIGIDFDRPQGVAVAAARRGTALEVVDGFRDVGETLERSNRILIEHPDGSMALYLHLAEDGAMVQVGESVQRGQLLATSGASGAPFAHLHFAVFATAQLESSIASYLERTDSLPINFRNADGPLDERGGLIAGQVYLALPF